MPDERWAAKYERQADGLGYVRDASLSNCHGFFPMTWTQLIPEGDQHPNGRGRKNSFQKEVSWRGSALLRCWDRAELLQESERIGPPDALNDPIPGHAVDGDPAPGYALAGRGHAQELALVSGFKAP